MTLAKNDRPFVNVRKSPFQLTLYKNKEIYVLQKWFFLNGPKYQKIGFKEHEIKALASVLFKLRKFKIEFNKLRRKGK